MLKPEPSWWAEARRLRAEGWKIIAIAALVGRRESTVQYALHVHIRKKQRARMQHWQASLTPEKRARVNALHRAAHRRRKEKTLSSNEKSLDTSDRGGKLAGDGEYHPPVN